MNDEFSDGKSREKIDLRIGYFRFEKIIVILNWI